MLQIRSWHLRLAVLLLATAVSAKRLPIRAFTTADGQIVVLYANGFGPTSVPVVGGSQTQSGTLAPLPSVTVGGVKATVQFAGLSAVGEFQFNVVLPSSLPDGDQTVVATYNGLSTQAGTLITILK